MIQPIFKQIYAAADVICLFYANNFMFGISACMINFGNKSEEDLQLTMEQMSWLMSLRYLLMFPAQCVGSLISECLGRRVAVSCAFVPVAVSCIIMSIANAPSTLLTASAILGLGSCGAGILGPILIAETTSPKNRSVLLCLMLCASRLGALTVKVTCKFFYWRNIVLFGLAPCVLGLVTSLTSPESPAWLAKHGRYRDCVRAFQWLRCEEDSDELRALVYTQRAAHRKTTLRTNIYSCLRIMRHLINICFLKALAISFACILIRAIIEMLMTVMISLSCHSCHRETVNYIYIGLDIQMAVCIFVSGLLVKVIQSRPVMFFTAVPAIFFLLLFCVAWVLSSYDIIPSDYTWVNLIILIIFCIFRDLGLYPIINNILSEVFPLSHRGVGNAAVGFFSFIVSFLGVSILWLLVPIVSSIVNFIVIVLGVIFLYFFMPETSHKTLQEIEFEMRREKLDINALEAEETDENDFINIGLKNRGT